MSKILYKSVFIFVITLLFLSPLTIYAGADDNLYTSEELLNTESIINGKAPLTKFKITSLNETNEIKTFEDKKVFSGTADSGSTITAKVYFQSADGKFKESKTYSSAVGASEVFSITIDFSIGESIIIIKAEKADKISAASVTVSRKDSQIRDKIKEQLNIVRIPIK